MNWLSKKRIEIKSRGLGGRLGVGRSANTGVVRLLRMIECMKSGRE